MPPNNNLYFSEFHTLIFDASKVHTLWFGHKWINIGGGENDRKSGTSPNLIWPFEDKAKLPNLLDKKEFNDRAFYPIGPKLDHNVNQ
jgi:hypothetical protein